MLKTIDRYVIREVVPPFILALLIFTFVLELPPVMQQLEQLLAKGVPWPTVGRIILLLSPQALGLTIPMALLVGLLIGLGRLSTDRESVALLACGVSPYRLLRPVLVLSGIAMAATMYVMIEAIPDANQSYREILFATLSKKVESDIKPRVFFQDFPNWVLYPRNEAAPGEPGWKDVLLANTSKPDAVEAYMAGHGRIVLDPAKRTVELILNDGINYSTTGPGMSSVAQFKQIIIRLDPDSVFPPVDLARGLTEKTIERLRKDIADKVGRKESPHNEIMAIHAKFSIPIACLVFGVISLALGLRVSKDGKLGGFVIGIGVIFAYYIAMFLAESAGQGPPHSRRIRALGAEPDSWSLRPDRPFLARRPCRGPPPVRHSTAPDSGFPKRSRERTRRHRRLRPPRTFREPSIRCPPGTRLVVRLPRFSVPGPSIIDRYISRHLRARCQRVFPGAARAVLHLHVHRSLRQDLQGHGDDRNDRPPPRADDAAVRLLRHSNCGTAERARDLRPAGAQQRADRHEGLRHQPLPHGAVAGRPVAGISAILFSLEQRLMASANRQADALDDEIRGRKAKSLNLLHAPLGRRRRPVIYFYGNFDPETERDARADRLQAASRSVGPRVGDLRSSRRFRRQGVDGRKRMEARTSPPIRRNGRTSRRTRSRGWNRRTYFTTAPPDAELMSVAELKRYTEELEPSGFNTVPLQVELHRKLAFPFVTLVMTLLAVPFGISAGKHGALYGVGLGIVIASPTGF